MSLITTQKEQAIRSAARPERVPGAGHRRDIPAVTERRPECAVWHRACHTCRRALVAVEYDCAGWNRRPLRRHDGWVV